MGNSPTVGDVLREQYAVCEKEYPKDQDMQDWCKGYAQQCVAQSVAYSQDPETYSSFEICAQTGDCEKTPPEVGQCMKMAVYLAGNFGPPAPLKPRAAVKKERQIGVWQAGDDVYDRLRKIPGFEKIDRSTHKVYYINADPDAKNDRDLVFIDRVGLPEEPYFLQKRPGDKIVRLSTGKVVTEKDDEGLKKFLQYYKLPRLDGINIEALVKYCETIKAEWPKLAAALQAESIDDKAVRQGYDAIIAAAKAVYPIELEGNVGLIDESWGAGLPKALLELMGPKAKDFLVAIAISYSDTGTVAPMDSAIAEAQKRGFKADEEGTYLLSMIRRNGYGNAVKTLVTNLEAQISDEKNTIESLMIAIDNLEGLLHAKATVGKGVLFEADDIVFKEEAREVRRTEVEARMDALRIKLTLRKTREIIAEERRKGVRGELPKAVMDRLMNLPKEYKVVDIPKAQELITAEIKGIVTGDAKKRVQELVVFAQKETRRDPPAGLTEGQMVLQEDWLRTINGALDNAVDVASKAGITDEVMKDIQAVRAEAYRKKVGLLKIEIEVSVGYAESSQNGDWYQDAKTKIAQAKELINDPRLISEPVRKELTAMIEPLELRAHKARVEQLIRLARIERDARAARGDTWFENMSKLLSEAEGILKVNKIVDKALQDKIDELRRGCHDIKLSGLLDEARAKVATLVIFEFKSADENNYLRDVDQLLDKILDVAKESDEFTGYAEKVIDLRRAAYQKYYDHHIALARHLLSVTPSPSSIDDKWLDGVLTQLKVAAEYLNAEHDGTQVFKAKAGDPDYIAQEMKMIEERERDAFIAEGMRFAERAKDMFSSRQKIRSTPDFLKTLDDTLIKADANFGMTTNTEDYRKQLVEIRKTGYLAYVQVLWDVANEEIEAKKPGWQGRAKGHLTAILDIFKKTKMWGSEEPLFKTIPMRSLAGVTEQSRSWAQDVEDLIKQVDAAK